MPAMTRTTLKFDPASLRWIGLRFTVVSNRYIYPLYAEIEKGYGLQRHDLSVIVCLSITNATTAQEIVRYTGNLKNSISRAVTNLERAGLLSRSTHPDDGRAASLALTAQGKKVFKQISGRFADRDAKMIARLNDDERREFTRLFNIISDSSVGWD